MPKIETTFVNPPVPSRAFDWAATFEGYDEGGPIGRGATEAAAIEDLVEQAT